MGLKGVQKGAKRCKTDQMSRNQLKGIDKEARKGQNMCFSDLPDDLQDMVVGFCFQIRTKELKHDLKTIFEIKSWNLPSRFIPRTVFCPETYGHVPHPFRVYRPMSHFRNNLRLFDMILVMDVLHRLDFRRNSVRWMGSRWDWMEKLQEWEFVGLFSLFIREVEKNPRNLKPNWLGMSLML